MTRSQSHRPTPASWGHERICAKSYAKQIVSIIQVVIDPPKLTGRRVKLSATRKRLRKGPENQWSRSPDLLGFWPRRPLAYDLAHPLR